MHIDLTRSTTAPWVTHNADRLSFGWALAKWGLIKFTILVRRKQKFKKKKKKKKRGDSES